MANNRMFLVCNHCYPGEWEFGGGGTFMLAKWFPSSGWYTSPTYKDETDDNEPMHDKLDKWLEAHDHGLEYGYRMEYEVEQK